MSDLHNFIFHLIHRSKICSCLEYGTVFIGWLIDWLIDWCLTSSKKFFSYIQDENNVNATGLEKRKCDG